MGNSSFGVWTVVSAAKAIFCDMYNIHLFVAADWF